LGEASPFPTAGTQFLQFQVTILARNHKNTYFHRPKLTGKLPLKPNNTYKPRYRPRYRPRPRALAPRGKCPITNPIFFIFLLFALAAPNTTAQQDNPVPGPDASVEEIKNYLLEEMNKEFNPGHLAYIVQLFYPNNQKNPGDVALMQHNKIRINPYLRFDNDSAPMPYFVYLYTKVRMVQKEPFVNLEVEMLPKGERWNDFSRYGIQLHAHLSPQIKRYDPVVQAVIDSINQVLAPVSDLKSLAGVLSQQMDRVRHTLKDLFKNRPEFKNGYDLARVTFFPDPREPYAYDMPQGHQHLGHYDKANAQSGQTIYLPYHAAPENRSMRIKGAFKILNDGIRDQDLRFTYQGRDLIPVLEKDSIVNFTITTGGHMEEVAIIATVELPDSTNQGTERFECGRITIKSYKEVRPKLTVVPVNRDQWPEGNRANLETYLNGKVFNQVLVDWDVSLHGGIKVKWDLNKDHKLAFGKEQLFTPYSEEMKAIKEAMAKDGSYDKQSSYLFLIDGFSDPGIKGYMPLKYQFGFVDIGQPGEQMYHTMAHELGHGKFRLQHTWEEYPSVPQGSTHNLMDYSAGGTELRAYQWGLIHDPQSMLFAWAQDEEEGAYTWTPVDKQHALLFNHVYDNNHIGSMNYQKAIEDAIAKGNDDTLSLAYTEDEAAKWTKEQKQWIDGWKIRAMNTDEVFTDIIKSIKETDKDEKIEKIVLRPKHIYIGKYKYEGVEYPVAIYGNGDKTVMTKAFTKIQVADAKELEDKKKKEHIYCDETYTKYLIIAFYEDEKDAPSMIMQVEKFDISQMQNTKEKWLEYLGILGEPVKYEITQEQLEEIFPNTDTTRLKEVMETINDNCGDFNINPTQRMSHFLGQIGTETGGMKALNENECYSEASIKSVFGKVKRNGNRKYCDLFEGYNGTSLSTCPGNTLCECNPVLPDSISLDSLTVKDKYICKSALFDYTYACRMGNGAPSTKDGSKFKGKGFIQLTGKNKYKQISDEWNKMYPDDPKEFHGKDIDLLTTDIEIAMKASMVCWKIQDLNDWADVGMTDKAIDKVVSIVNGSGSNKPNGYDHRRSYTKKANEVLSK
jgi:predicted chitinase